MTDDDNTTIGERKPLLIADHRVAVLVGMTILIAILFTSFGLVLYNASGTAQLDLSRPSYGGVGEVVEQQEQQKQEQGLYVEYPAGGPINETTLREFDELYRRQVDSITSVDAFGGDPLAPDTLGMQVEAE